MPSIRCALMALVVLGFCACDGDPEDTSSQPDTAPQDTSTTDDTAEVDSQISPEDTVEDIALMDTSEEDAPSQDVQDVMDGEGSSCTGDCRALSVVLEWGSESQAFDRAYYGITTPAASASGRYELYFEIYAGGAEGCPDQDTPTPDMTLIVNGVALPGEEPLSATATFLDFTGRFLPSTPFESAQSVSLTAVDASLCTDCIGKPEPSDPDGFAAYALSIAFAQGNASGHLFATHCDSFDDPGL